LAAKTPLSNSSQIITSLDGDPTAETGRLVKVVASKRITLRDAVEYPIKSTTTGFPLEQASRTAIGNFWPEVWDQDNYLRIQGLGEQIKLWQRLQHPLVRRITPACAQRG
jgi:hypothetical protein